jgi:hypothetical protein
VGRGSRRELASLIPSDLARERGAVLHRALRDLPLALLEALVRGLRRHSDSLVTGRLYDERGAGGCAVGVMLRELSGKDCRPPLWRRRRSPETIYEEHPEMARVYPRLAHIELIFDKTCQALRDARPELSERESARKVGLWMAAEAQAEINLRHLEAGADTTPEGMPRAADREELFGSTVSRVRELRPWLSQDEAIRAVAAWIATPEEEHAPLFVPDEWVEEVRLQGERVTDDASA